MASAYRIPWSTIHNPQRVEFEPGKGVLSFLQSEVDGMIEGLPFPIEGVHAWINEEGKYQAFTHVTAGGSTVTVEGLPSNPAATKIMAEAELLFENDWIAGTMLLTSMDENGDTIGLTDGQVALIQALVVKTNVYSEI